MTVDAKDWLEHVESLPETQRARGAQARHRETAKVVALKMEDLLGASEWAVYRQHLEGLVTLGEADLAHLSASLVDLGGEPLLSAQRRAAEVRGELRAYRLALALPERLRAAAAEGA